MNNDINGCGTKQMCSTLRYNQGLYLKELKTTKHLSGYPATVPRYEKRAKI